MLSRIIRLTYCTLVAVICVPVFFFCVGYISNGFCMSVCKDKAPIPMVSEQPPVVHLDPPPQPATVPPEPMVAPPRPMTTRKES